MSEKHRGELAEHLPRMYRVALRIVGDADRAQDVAQDACLKALQGMGGFGGRSSLTTWLHRITVNCALDHLRSRDRSMNGRVDMSVELAGIPTSLVAGPAVQAERREMFQRAVELMGKFHDDCRSAFTLTQLDGYSYDEAAVIEGQPRGTIASRVYRAKRILLEGLEGSTHGGRDNEREH